MHLPRRAGYIITFAAADPHQLPPEDPLLLLAVIYGFWVGTYVAFSGEALRELAAQFLARIWRTAGKRGQARAPLAPVYDWFTEGFETRDLQEAGARLGSLAR